MTNKQKQEARKLAKEGSTAKEISEEVGCSVATAKQYIKTFRK